MTDSALRHTEDAIREFDNVRWDDIWLRVDAGAEDDFARWSRKYVGYVRDSLEKARAALAAAPPAAQDRRGADEKPGGFIATDLGSSGWGLEVGESAILTRRSRASAAITEAAPPAPDTGLDVERLGQALQTAWPTHQEGSGGTGDVEHRTWEVIDPAYPSDALAERIAAEYARLSPTSVGGSDD